MMAPIRASAESNSSSSTVTTRRRVIERDCVISRRTPAEGGTRDGARFQSEVRRHPYSVSAGDLRYALRSRWNDAPNRNRTDVPEAPAGKLQPVAGESDIPECDIRSGRDQWAGRGAEPSAAPYPVLNP